MSTQPRLPVATLSASRNSPSSENAAKKIIADRVTRGAKPAHFHHNAIHAITSGGCAFETVVCGIRSFRQQKIARGRNIVSGFIPKIGQLQKRRM